MRTETQALIDRWRRRGNASMRPFSNENGNGGPVMTLADRYPASMRPFSNENGNFTSARISDLRILASMRPFSNENGNVKITCSLPYTSLGLQ